MRPVEMKDLYSYQFLSGVVAAPKGERAAFVVKQAREESNDYASDIWLYDAGKIRRLTTDGKGTSPVWEDDRHILFPAMREEKDKTRAQDGERFSVWYRLDSQGGEAVRAFELPVQASSLQRVDEDTWAFCAEFDRANPEEYLMNADERKELQKRRKEEDDYHILTDLQYHYNGRGFCENVGMALYVYHVSTGVTERISTADMKVRYFRVWNHSLVFAACPYRKEEDFRQQVYLWHGDSQTTEALYGAHDHEFADLLPLGDKLIALACAGDKHGLNQNNSVYELKEGKLVRLADPDFAYGSSVGSDCRLGGGKSIVIRGEEAYFACTIGSDAQLRKLDANGKISLVNKHAGSLDCFDITEKGTVLGIGLYDMRLSELYAIGKGTKLRKLTTFNDEALKDCYVAQPQPISVLSHGKRIYGWVLLPIDYDPEKSYPAVLDIHGGPKTVYGEVYYQEMQLWAGRGYFVFFCNPTGSDGRGDAFMDIRGKYGTIDYENIMDFTDGVLKAYPQIDAKRVAVTGGSYGGFMTNWIIGHTDRFACAATQRSISNWFSYQGVSDIGGFFTSDQNMSDLFFDRKKLWFHSPLNYADKVVTPTLFIHSDEDYRCPIDQGLQLYGALVQKGVDTRFVWFKGENHELSRSGKPKHRMKRLQEITAWIEKYTKGE